MFISMSILLIVWKCKITLFFLHSKKKFFCLLLSQFAQQVHLGLDSFLGIPILQCLLHIPHYAIDAFGVQCVVAVEQQSPYQSVTFQTVV